LSFILLGLNPYFQHATPAQESSVTQQPVSRAHDDSPPTNLKDDMDMQNWITVNGKMAERMASLGVERGFAEEWTSTVEDYHVYPEFKSFRIGPHHRAAVLFLPCVSFVENATLYLLMTDDHAWKVSDKLELDCHYDDKVSFEIASIRDPQRDEIQIHHACVGHGTGYWEQVFAIYSVNGQKFKLEILTDELLHEVPAGGSPLELNRNSTFTLIPVAGSRSRVIEETRSQDRNGKFTVQRRQFHWNSVRARYEPSPFTLVQATVN